MCTKAKHREQVRKQTMKKYTTPNTGLFISP